MYYIVAKTELGMDTVYDGTNKRLLYLADGGIDVCYPRGECPPDTKVYALVDGHPPIELWPCNDLDNYRAEYYKEHGRLPALVPMSLTAKSESQPDFVFE